MIEKIINIPWPGWELVEQIGRGQFGTVYKISSSKYGITEYAAMKVISIPNDPQMIQMDYSYGYDKDSVAAKYKSYLDEVLKEYQLMMKVKGSNGIVRCDDISVQPHEDGIGWDVYIRMEYLTPILSVLSEISNEESIIQLGIDLCNALKACEKAGILHRDIKPSNILINDQGDFKLGDFGVSRTLENGNTYGTKGVGTYDYMAPEIYNGGKYGKEADIYSLGMVMYWLLNNRTLPFLTKGKAPTSQEITTARQRRFNGEELPLPINGCEALKIVVFKACSFNPQIRYSSAEEMLDDLIEINYIKSQNKKADPIIDKEHTVNIYEKAYLTKDEQHIDSNTQNSWRDSQETVGKDYASKNDAFNESHINNAGSWTDSQETVGKSYSVYDDNDNLETIGNDLNASEKATYNSGKNFSVIYKDKPKDNFLLIRAIIGLMSLVLIVVLIWSKKQTKATGSVAETTAEIIAEETTAENTVNEQKVPIRDGDYIIFGRYEQDGDKTNGPEPIEWEILSEEDGRMLLISRYVLDYQPYNSELTNVTWETCSLRTWLNEDFINAAFDASEQDQILTVTNSNPDNPIWGTEGGKDTKDKIFLLSIDEANTFFSGNNSRATGSWWWLRSPCDYPNYAAIVSTGGEVGDYGGSVSNDYGVRPALWLNLNS